LAAGLPLILIVERRASAEAEMTADEVEIGRAVRLEVPMDALHRATGTIVELHRDPLGEPLTAKVQIDGSGEHRWLHRVQLELVRGYA
jgi:hypothetical protein